MEKHLNNQESISKSTITIEKEFYEENGIPMVKRVIKEDGTIYYEDTQEVSRIFDCARKLDSFEKWFDDIKHPERPEPKRHSSKDRNQGRPRPIDLNPDIFLP